MQTRYPPGIFFAPDKEILELLTMRTWIITTSHIFLFLAIGISSVFSQHFGRNKVIYDRFNFRVYETPNFEIHHYLEDETEIEEFAQLIERWYRRLQVIFLDTLEERSPVILYSNHADFQQTTIIPSLVGIGTGGVTEGFRKRIVMPLSSSRRQTDHVLGHELAHVFHFRLLLGNGGRGLGGGAMQNVPLWMTEGQSEYLTIGSTDTQTAMWMRDAVKNDDIPTINDLTNRPMDYFPYRWGHAFWAYFAGMYGDAQVLPLYVSTARMGVRRAIDSLTGYSADSLSELWAASIRNTYEPLMEGKQEYVGERIFGTDNAGEMNIAPSISPDGENIIFISDRNVISLDFFLGNIREKQITRRITNILRDTHIDEYNFLESAGTWSPDGTQFALSTFVGGRNQLLVADIERGRIARTIAPGDLLTFNNPHWSPDGESILLSGMSNGRSNLFLYNFETEELTQLTDDRYAALHPSWSPDGSRVAFITDRGGGTDFDQISFGNYRLAEYDINTGEINVFDILPGADIVNPKYSPDGTEIFFISNADGFRNIYRYDLIRDHVRKVTDLMTGVSGITELSPGFDISNETGTLVYILYDNTGYELYSINVDELDGPIFRPADVDLTASILPPGDVVHPVDIVDANLERFPLTDPAEFSERGYDPRFSLEAIGSPGIGIGTSQFGTGMAGGVSFMFSDMLRENTLTTILQVQGRIIDIAGQLAYINQSRRMNWGAVFSHFPYRSAFASLQQEEINGAFAQNLVVMEQRIFEQELGLFAHYPLSRQLRFEGGIRGSMYSFRVDSINNYYVGNRLVDREIERIDSPESFFLGRAYIAYVGDGSQFGFTSPMEGYRYRFQVDRTAGEFGFWSFMADYRQYRFISPISVGYRLMHYGRYGIDAQRLQPLYLGNPYFVRGYSFRALQQPRVNSEEVMNINNLVGSKIAVANAEVRFPFTGPERLALIRSRMIFSDLVLFADGGLAWHDFDDVAFNWSPSRDSEEHIPVFSTGLALRVNLFGAIIVEPYFAFPFQRRADSTTGTLGFHISFGGF
jgi:Tol biopolymer transport system component